MEDVSFLYLHISLWKLFRECFFFCYFIGFILLCIVMYQRKNWKSYFTYVLPVVCGAIGYLLLLLSPSGSAKFSENLSLPLIFKNAVEIFTEYYNTCRIPLIFSSCCLVSPCITNSIRRKSSLPLHSSLSV